MLGPVGAGDRRGPRRQGRSRDRRGRIPEGVPIHLKLDTGWGGGGFELLSPTRDVVGLMSHLARGVPSGVHAAPDRRFREATAGAPPVHASHREQRRDLRYSEARFDAVRCGIALCGIFAVRHGSDSRGWNRRCAGVVRRPRQASRARREHRVRAPPGRPTDVDRSSLSAMRTASAATCREPTFSSTEPARGSSLPFHGRACRAPRSQSSGRDAGDPRGERNPHGGARSHRRHDRVRDRHRPEHTIGPAPSGHDRWMSGSARSCAGGGVVVGGAIRDEPLRPSLDSTSPVPEPREGRNALPRRFGGPVFPLSERHGAWRVVADGRTRPSTSRRSAGDRRRPRDHDFTRSTPSLSMFERATHDPHDGRADLEAGVIRAVSESVFHDDPPPPAGGALRGRARFRMDERTEALLPRRRLS